MEQVATVCASRRGSLCVLLEPRPWHGEGLLWSSAPFGPAASAPEIAMNPSRRPVAILLTLAFAICAPRTADAQRPKLNGPLRPGTSQVVYLAEQDEPGVFELYISSAPLTKESARTRLR